MNDNELRAIIEQVLTEMNVSGTASASADGNAVKTAVVNAVKNAGCEQAEWRKDAFRISLRLTLRNSIW